MCTEYSREYTLHKLQEVFAAIQRDNNIIQLVLLEHVVVGDQLQEFHVPLNEERRCSLNLQTNKNNSRNESRRNVTKFLHSPEHLACISPLK